MTLAAAGAKRHSARIHSNVFKERELLDAARCGDEEAFRLLIAPVRGALYAYCRRLLGSTHDAEDAMQEVMLRAWRGLGTFEGRAPLRTWLLRIACNACMTAIEKRPKSVVPIDYEPAVAGPCPHPEDGWSRAREDEEIATESMYERHEAAAAAVDIALRSLPATQRAVLILREVLGYSARETAMILETTTASVNSALQRARANLDDGSDGRARRDRRRPESLIQDAVEGFVEALDRGDVDTLVAIAADATLATARSWSYSPLPAY